jgi:hypothetical protein
MNPKIKGVICGIVAAITYGTNPLGALNLYAEGVNPPSILFYRLWIVCNHFGSAVVFAKTIFQGDNERVGNVGYTGCDICYFFALSFHKF